MLGLVDVLCIMLQRFGGFFFRVGLPLGWFKFYFILFLVFWLVGFPRVDGILDGGPTFFGFWASTHF
jgi:hypothetical protein